MLTRRLCSLLYLFLIFVLSALLLTHRTQTDLPLVSRRPPNPFPAAAKNAAGPRLVSSVVAHLPLSFEENRGQAGSEAEFVSRGPGYSLALSGRSAVLVHRAKVRLREGDWLSQMASFANPDQSVSSRVQLTWLGANPNARAEGVDRQQGTSNYLLGNDPKKWRTEVPRFGSVRFASVYRGIDLVYHGNQDRIEMDYVVAPNADPRAIRMAVGGPSIVEIEPNGNLSISGEGDEVTLKAPVAYQEIHGQRQTVNARFVLESSHTVALVLGNYDPSQQLTIDPVLDYSASFGGGDDIIADVVTDSQGYVYLAGTTCSTSYPTTGSALQQNLGDSPEAYACNDAIVTKLDPTASSLIYSTYIGGSNADFAVRLNVDGSGNVILAGSTNSPNFPTTSGAYLTSLKKNNCTFSPYIVNQQCSDGFLLKLDPTGSTLLFSTLLGGERADFILALAVDSPSGNIYVAGATNSVTFPIAVPASAPQPAYGGDNGTCQMVTGIPFTVPCFDAFVAEFNPQGTQLIASTYLGGNDDDGAFAMAIDSNHSVYVTGDTDSAGFPVTMGAYQTVHTPGDQRDVFVTKLNSSLSSLAYSTFIGGSSDDYPMMIRVDSGGNAYVTGSTASADYPTTSGALQTIYAGPSTDDCPATLEEVDIGALYCGDVFVTKLSPAGNSLVFSTYFGTSQDDGGLNLALDSSQNVWVIGGTHSSSFPLTPDAYYNSQTFSTSAFLAEIKSDGTQNLFSTMIPGQLGLGLEVDSSNNVIVAGEYPMSGYAATATPGTYNDGQGGVFLLKFSPGTAQSGVTLSSTSSLFASNTIQFPYTQPDSASATVPVTLQNTGTGTLHLSISIATPPFGGSAQPFIQTNNCGSSVLPSQSCTIQVLYEPTGISGSDSAAIVIQDDAPGAPHTITLGGQSDYSLTASFIPTTLNFGRLQPGVTSTSLSAFLNGTGDIYAKTTGAPFVSGNTSDFIVNTTNCGIGLSFCSIQAQFSPQSGESGVRTAQVSVPTNAPNSPQVLTLTGNATSGPALTFNINPLTFSAADVGTSRSSAILLMNTGGADLNITGLNFSNPAFSYDALFGTCGQTPSVAQPMILHAQGTCTFSVTFAPTATGLQTGTVTFTDNDPASPTLNVSGQASSPTGPHLSLIATPNPQPDGSMAFADTVVGQSTAPIAALITVLNLSPGGQVQVTNLTLSPDYTLSQPCGTLPIVITSGNACTFNVYFSPQAAGPRPGTLTIQTDAPGGVTFTQKFTGNGVMIPAVNLSSTKLDFGKQVVNQTSSPMTSILTNTGGAPLSIGNIAITPPFTQTNNCPRPLAAGASCVFSVKFTSPTQSGPATGQLTFSANAAGGSYVIGLSGSGITGPVLAAQPASLNFNGQAIGTTSAAQSVTLQNVGDTAVSVTSIHTMANFKQTNNCPATLAPAAACTINVSFTPSTNNFADFPVSGSVLVDNNGTGSPLAVPLAGTALGVTAATSSTLLGSSANPSIIGQQLTLTATITSGTAGTPSGYVSFYDGTTEIGAGLLSSQAIATYQTTALYLGTHSITAQYSGDSTYGPSTSNIVTQFVVEGAKTSSTTALVSSLNPSTTGQSVTFTATVTPPSGTPVPTGSVTFLDGETSLSTGLLNGSGVATYSTASLSAGSHPITAIYGGDANFAPSASNTVTQQVTIPVLAITTLSPAATTAGGPSFTLTVNGSNFVSGSIVNFNGSMRATTFVSATQMTVSIDAADIALAGWDEITVANPDSTVSNGVAFPINGGSVSPTMGPALRYVPVTPCRLVDTRTSPNGPFAGPSITGGTSRNFTVPVNTTCNIPATAAAYSLNVAVIPAGPLGFLTLWPTGQTQPVAATVSSIDGRVRSNAAIVPAGTGGAISAFASNTTDLVLDINGYFTTDTTALQFYPVNPCRVLDTRNANGPLGGPSIAGNTSRTFPLPTGSCNLPGTAQAYSLNLAVVPQGPLGYLTAWPTGQTQPGTANLSSTTGTVTASAAIVPAGTSGSIDVYASNTTDLIIDVNGYFAPAGTGGLSLYSLPPCRVLDTRQSSDTQTTQPFSGELDENIQAGDCGAPAGAQAYVLNATVVPSTPLGFLTLWQQGTAQPLAATLSALDQTVTSNLAIVPTSNASISTFASNPTRLVLDIFGYFAP